MRPILSTDQRSPSRRSTLTRRIARAVRVLLQFLLGDGLVCAVLYIGMLGSERPRRPSLRRAFAQHNNLPLELTPCTSPACRLVRCTGYSILRWRAGMIGGQTREAAPARAHGDQRSPGHARSQAVNPHIEIFSSQTTLKTAAEVMW